MLNPSAMSRALAIVSASAILTLALLSRVSADAGSVVDDERAGMCAAFDGVSFAFCVALCEARECDLRAVADERCVILRRGFARATGGVPPPCMPGAIAPARTLPRDTGPPSPMRAADPDTGRFLPNEPIPSSGQGYSRMYVEARDTL